MDDYKYNQLFMSALNTAIGEYKGLTERISGTVKIISSLLICLGGIVTAVTALFTVYCICMPKNGVSDYVMFGINVLSVLIAFVVDCFGILPAHLSPNGGTSNSEEQKQNVLITNGYIENDKYDTFNDSAVNKMKMIGNNGEDRDVDVLNNCSDEITLYRNASKTARAVLAKKRKQLLCAIACTAFCLAVLFVSVIVSTAL